MEFRRVLFRSPSKTCLSTWWNNPCWQAQTSDFSCSWSPGLHTSQEGFWSFADPLQILKVAFSMGGNEVQAQYYTLHGPIHSPLDAVESSCTIGRETARKHNVSTSMLDGGDGHIQHSSQIGRA